MPDQEVSPGRGALHLGRITLGIHQAPKAAVSRLITGCAHGAEVSGTALRQWASMLMHAPAAPHGRRGRAIIAQAIAVIVADCCCSADEARRALRDTARETGNWSTAIAAEVIESTVFPGTAATGY